MKLKFITLTCPKYHNTRVKQIKNTWGKTQQIIFLSDTTVVPDIIGYDYIPNGYENVWCKYVEFLKNYTNDETDWIFFTDDDTFVNISNAENLLKNYDPNLNICIGRMGLLNSDGTDKDGNQTGFPFNTISGVNAELPLWYPGGGSGFVLSRTAMLCLTTYIKNIIHETIPRCINGDVTFGFWLKNCNIKLIDIVGFWWTNPSNLNHSLEEIKKSITYHYASEKIIEYLYNLTNEDLNNTRSG